MNKRWAGPVIAIAFLMSMIAIGHGIAPMAFLLLIAMSVLNPFAMLGWIAALLLLSGAILSGRTATVIVWIGSGISFLVWLYWLWDSAWQSTILLSAHYFAALFYFLVYRPVVHPEVD